jgi:threonine aldolase
MADAEVGDDVFGEDPTAIRLQARVAEILGKEAALFVPSGTMGNQICIAAQTRPGDEVLLDEHAHILNFEGGAPALLAGVQLRPLPGHRGRITADQVAGSIRGGASHYAPTTMVAVENTHNRASGTVYALDELDRLRQLTAKRNVILHMDGARIWNAAAASRCPESEIASYADSLSVCFSKGLGAPVGSAVAGSKDFIKRAHRYRKLFGGGMRQMGVLAAAALYALDNHRARLAEDHANAAYLADLLTQAGQCSIERPVQTNILMVTLVNSRVSAADLAKRCAAAGVLFFPEGDTKFRLVTHLDVPAAAIKPAADIILQQLES